VDAGSRKTISAVIITKNEEANLGRCLESIKWVDEIIVVDSDSTDRTGEIAARYNACFFTTQWEGFGPAKQYAVEQATGDWILSIDADEEITDALAREINEAINGDKSIVAYYVPRMTLFLDRWIRHSGWYPDYVLRLFRRNKASFTEALVHEELIAEGLTGRLKNHLRHYSYPDLDTYYRKLERYSGLAAEEMYKNGRRHNALTCYIKPLATFLRHYVFRVGFLDGYRGWQIACLSAKGKRMRYRKLKELCQDDRS
jgi:glycosyltransferase involved in cell wall biosynthesis